MKPAIPDRTTVLIVISILALALMVWVYVQTFFRMLAMIVDSSERMCDEACSPRDGYAVDERCYCENEGLALVPIDQMVPDTGCRKDTD